MEEDEEDADEQLLGYALRMSGGGRLVPCAASSECASDESVKILSAIDDGDTYSLRELSTCAAAFSEVDSEGWLPLHRAAIQPVKEVLETVIFASCALTLEEKTLDGETAATLAIQAGWVENVKALLDQGASPNTPNDKNESPLLLAVRTCSYEMVSMLVMGGAFVEQTSQKTWSTLHEAAKVGSGDIMMLLLRNGGKVTATDGHGVTLLGVAAEHANVEVMEILIKNGADVNARASNGDSVLYDAAGSGNPDCIDLLLEHRADPNVHSLCAQLPIHRAAYEGHYLALRRLIPITTKRAIRLSGQSPVHSAADGGHPQCLELLIESGFDVNATLDKHISENYADMRKSALYFAVSNGDVACTEMLLNAGAKPDADPLRCLLVAVRAGRYEIVRLLLAKQADVNCCFTAVSDTAFPTALQYCLRDEMMMRLLLNNGYDAESCFVCRHDDALVSRYPGRDYDPCGVQDEREKIPFCDFISLSWLMHLAGCTVRILLDYVGHVTVCSSLKAVLRKQRQWPDICHILGNPRPLKHLCRLVIRARITAKRLSEMDSAPFPPRVKDYLLFGEYDLYRSITGLTESTTVPAF